MLIVEATTETTLSRIPAIFICVILRGVERLDIIIPKLSIQMDTFQVFYDYEVSCVKDAMLSFFPGK